MHTLDRIAIVSVFLAACLGSSLFGQQTNAPVWDLGVFRVPPGFDPSPGKELKDASEFLRKSGMPTPPGSEALHDPNSSQLFVRNTPENVSLVESLATTGGGSGSQIASETLEIRVFDCRPEGSAVLPLKNIRYADLENLPPTQIELVDSFSVTMESGFTAGLNREDPERSQRGRRQEKPDTTINIFVNPDAVTASAVISTQIDLRGSTPISISGTYALRASEPAVLTTLPHPNGKGSTLVILGNLTRQDPTGSEIEFQNASANR
jgi:hypothetical protein